jgi:uncharacterized protein
MSAARSTSIASAIWRRLDLPGHDAVLLTHEAEGSTLEGQATFHHPQGPSALRYRSTLAQDWSTIDACFTGFIGVRRIEHRIRRTPAGWSLDGVDQGMSDIVDLDLAFTPATNLAQLQRVGLAIGETATFDVAWLEAGAAALVRLPQRYRRLSSSEYDYASPKHAYHATLQVSSDGFVASYPGLWTREG